MYDAHIIADSLHPNGRDRLTTMEIVLPRPFLSEVNTHRVLSRNSESSRAKPPERRIAEINDGLGWVPTFGGRVAGMGQGDLDDETQHKARGIWTTARSYCVNAAQQLIELGVDKSHINRLLEPFVWQRVLVTADDWSNFLALRTHEDAAPEMQAIAHLMAAALRNSTPRPLRRGEWHLPYTTERERRKHGPLELLALSTGRCALISYDNLLKDETMMETLGRFNRLTGSGHMSPAEHQARPRKRREPRRLRGNFSGDWVQHRKTLRNEDRFDRVLAGTRGEYPPRLSTQAMRLLNMGGA
jgi:hypothetical protein